MHAQSLKTVHSHLRYMIGMCGDMHRGCKKMCSEDSLGNIPQGNIIKRFK